MIENRTCQNCKARFVIEDEDFAFYAKISVPPPTFCPECRMVRRMTWRNARTVYKRKVLGAENEVYASFSPQSPLIVYEQKHWWSDAWDAMEQGREYDFSKPFFEQLRELMLSVPWPHGYNVNSTNSEYCNNSDGLKDCYLLFNSGFSESSAFGTEVLKSTACFDCTKVYGCELSRDLLDCERCYRTFSCVNCAECTDVYFSTNLTDCQNCFGCVGLRHKKYCVFNKQLTQEEFESFMQNTDLGSYRAKVEANERARKLAIGIPRKFMHGVGNVDVSGNYLDYSKTTKSSFLCRDMENCSYCQLILFMRSRDSYDITVAAGELCYELEEAGGYQVLFSWFAMPKNLESGQISLSHLKYTMGCRDSSHLFACVGLRNKQYCILNKQYTKEEYEKLVPRIIEHMNTMPHVDARGRVYKYGEFFPPKLSPFAYNETIAQEYFPLTKDEALAQGYRWRDPDTKHYAITKTPEFLPDHIKDVDDGILKETIGCAHSTSSWQAANGTCLDQCTTAFRIIPEELQFYRKMNLPLPRLCPNCRHYERLKQRNPLKLWHRRCMCKGEKREMRDEKKGYANTATHFHGDKPCSNEFETSYAPERPEIVYCESCYNSEIA
ncbi:MAG: hypothetical protein AAB867_00675 [Patescibacteria group bacterium]